MKMDFPTWKTISVGTFESCTALNSRLRFQGFGNRFDRLRHIHLVEVKKEIELVRTSARNLYKGLKGLDKARGLSERGAIYARAKEVGLDLCPDEVPYQLLLQLTCMEVFTEIEWNRSNHGFPYMSLQLATRLVRPYTTDDVYPLLINKAQNPGLEFEREDPFVFSYGMDGGPQVHEEGGWGLGSTWIFAKPSV